MTLSNPFRAFYTVPVELVKITGTGRYNDSDGKFDVLGSVMADVQPYSGGLAEKEYGLAEQIEKRMFCDPAEIIKQGDIAVIGGERYDILYTETWEMGTMALLRKRRK